MKIYEAVSALFFVVSGFYLILTKVGPSVHSDRKMVPAACVVTVLSFLFLLGCTTANLLLP